MSIYIVNCLSAISEWLLPNTNIQIGCKQLSWTKSWFFFTKELRIIIKVTCFLAVLTGSVLPNMFQSSGKETSASRHKSCKLDLSIYNWATLALQNSFPKKSRIYGLQQTGCIFCLKLVIFCYSLSHFCDWFWNVPIKWKYVSFDNFSARVSILQKFSTQKNL